MTIAQAELCDAIEKFVRNHGSGLHFNSSSWRGDYDELIDHVIWAGGIPECNRYEYSTHAALHAAMAYLSNRIQFVTDYCTWPNVIHNETAEVPEVNGSDRKILHDIRRAVLDCQSLRESGASADEILQAMVNTYHQIAYIILYRYVERGNNGKNDQQQKV